MYDIYMWFNGKPMKLSTADTWSEALIHCEAYHKKDSSKSLLIVNQECDEVHSWNDLFE